MVPGEDQDPTDESHNCTSACPAVGPAHVLGMSVPPKTPHLPSGKKAWPPQKGSTAGPPLLVGIRCTTEGLAASQRKVIAEPVAGQERSAMNMALLWNCADIPPAVLGGSNPTWTISV